MGPGDIFLVRLAFVEVRATVCLPQETYQSFVSQSSPALRAGTNLLVCEPLA
jgi:hypothetical protein